MCPQQIDVLLSNFLFPIVVAITTYLLFDRLGEWRKRRNHSKLGIAIIASLQEEIRSGISVMKDALRSAKDKSSTAPPTATPPGKSWSGMTTISDDVLLRILATTDNKKFEGSHPRDCRIHCKNYFEHMCQNYLSVLRESLALVVKGMDWRDPLIKLLAETESKYIAHAEGVDRMLDNAKALLDSNAKSWFPK